MTRDISVIVASRLEAKARRDAGKPIWDKTIYIDQVAPKGSDYLSLPLSDIKQLAKNYADAVAHKLASYIDDTNDNYDDALYDIQENFLWLAGEVEAITEAEQYGELTGVIESFYNWADVKRIRLVSVYPDASQDLSPGV